MIAVEVPLGDRSYPVLVGDGARHELAGVLPAGTRRVAVVTQAGVPGEVDPGVPHEVLDGEAAAVPAGAEGVQLLPYLQGERTPVWDASARGAFTGLSLAHGRGHLYRAVLEAVAVSLRHAAEIAREGGLHFREVVAVNGGARSALWRQILCDALSVDLLYVPDHPGAPAGAATRPCRRSIEKHAPSGRNMAQNASALSRTSPVWHA